MRAVILIMAALCLASCNLSDQPAGLVTPATFVPETTDAVTSTIEVGTPAPLTPSALPGVTLQPNSGLNTATPMSNGIPTRTPFGILSGARTALPTQLTGERAVINAPADGATVSSPLVISGTVSNLPDNAFTLQLVSGDGDVLNSQPITLQNPANASDIPWSASMLVSRYTGVAQLRLVGRTADNREALLAAVNVTIGTQTAGQPNTTGGGAASGSSLGSITTPGAGSTTTGDPLIVEGTAGNFPETTFTLALMTRDGVILNSQTVTINGGSSQRVPWAASLGTGGYRGPAEIRAFLVRDGQNILIASVNVTVG
jgi:hypothetical protein